MRFLSTRGGSAPASFTDILLSGLAPDGGLYVPENWEKPAESGQDYVSTAQGMIAPSVAGDLSTDELRQLLGQTYTPGTFGSAEITPLRQITDGLYLLELFHGPTLAFKDVALQFLGRLFDHVLAKSGRHLTIIGATSGDTGSAAIEACRGRKNISVTILHPQNRTSEVQRRQMTTVRDDNVHNIAITGTFDDCQALVKQAFADPDLRRLNLSAINSINWARIVAQSVYYALTCARLGGPVDFAVPTGNFGNVYAGYVAQRMGVPVGQLMIGSNRNDILTRFFETGAMVKEDVIPSLSPSMDIQVSSNFERYLYDLCDRDSDQVRSIMAGFAGTGSYQVGAGLHAKARAQFSAAKCTDEQTLETIRDVYRTSGVLIDPHTAVGVFAAGQAHREDKARPLVALACAHPAKFPDAVFKATGIRPALPDALADLMQRPEIFDVLPNDFKTLKTRLLEGTPT